MHAYSNAKHPPCFRALIRRTHHGGTGAWERLAEYLFGCWRTYCGSGDLVDSKGKICLGGVPGAPIAGLSGDCIDCYNTAGGCGLGAGIYRQLCYDRHRHDCGSASHGLVIFRWVCNGCCWHVLFSIWSISGISGSRIPVHLGGRLAAAAFCGKLIGLLHEERIPCLPASRRGVGYKGPA
jgi:hypothetical protein